MRHSPQANTHGISQALLYSASLLIAVCLCGSLAVSMAACFLLDWVLCGNLVPAKEKYKSEIKAVPSIFFSFFKRPLKEAAFRGRLLPSMRVSEKNEVSPTLVGVQNCWWMIHLGCWFWF